MSKALIAALVPALLLTAGAATAQTASPRAGEPAEISIARRSAIRDFRVEQDGRGAYLQDRQRHWYRASFAAPCQGFHIGFRAAGDKMLKPGATVLMRNLTMQTVEECRVAALVRSEAPRWPRSEYDNASISTPWRDRPSAIGAVSQSSPPIMMNSPRP